VKAVGGGKAHWAQHLPSVLQRFVAIYLPQKEIYGIIKKMLTLLLLYTPVATVQHSARPMDHGKCRNFPQCHSNL